MSDAIINILLAVSVVCSVFALLAIVLIRLRKTDADEDDDTRP